MPILPADSSPYNILVIPFNTGETQVFALDKQGRIISPSSNGIWDKSHRSLVDAFLHQARPIEATQRCELMAGVYHFGHTIGDQLETLFMHSKNRFATSNSPILLFNTKPSVHKLLRLLDIGERFQNISVSHPVILKCNGLVSLIKQEKGLAPNTSTMATIATYIGKKLDFYLGSSRALRRSTGLKVFLSSEKHSRLSNRSEILPILQSRGWITLDPLKTPLMPTLTSIRTAKQLVSENGSILFNIFLSREKEYRVLTSERILTDGLGEQQFFSGERYNLFHLGLFTYVACRTTQQSHKHPFADKITVCPSLFE